MMGDPHVPQSDREVRSDPVPALTRMSAMKNGLHQVATLGGANGTLIGRRRKYLRQRELSLSRREVLACVIGFLALLVGDSYTASLTPDVNRLAVTADIGSNVKALQAAGAASLRAIAAGLNDQGIPTARGSGLRTATQVARVLQRLE
jgi:hypothetical protein